MRDHFPGHLVFRVEPEHVFHDFQRFGMASQKVKRPMQVVRIEEILARLDVAVSTNDLNTPGYRLHPLKGNLRGFWSIRVSANMRIIFRIEAGDVFDVDLTDYH